MAVNNYVYTKARDSEPVLKGDGRCYTVFASGVQPGAGDAGSVISVLKVPKGATVVNARFVVEAGTAAAATGTLKVGASTLIASLALNTVGGTPMTLAPVTVAQDSTPADDPGYELVTLTTASQAIDANFRFAVVVEYVCP